MDLPVCTLLMPTTLPILAYTGHIFVVVNISIPEKKNVKKVLYKKI